MVNSRPFFIFGSLVALSNVGADNEGYGVDCSFPIHSKELSCGDLLGDRKAVYEEYMQGCREQWGVKGAARCDMNEKDRLEMSRRQPQSMVVSETHQTVNSSRLPKEADSQSHLFFAL